jgi:hypothetical protein
LSMVRSQPAAQGARQRFPNGGALPNAAIGVRMAAMFESTVEDAE